MKLSKVKCSKMSYAYIFINMTSKVFTFLSVIILCRANTTFPKIVLKRKKDYLHLNLHL